MYNEIVAMKGNATTYESGSYLFGTIAAHGDLSVYEFGIGEVTINDKYKNTQV